jgi:hypothetical protein
MDYANQLANYGNKSNEYDSTQIHISDIHIVRFMFHHVVVRLKLLHVVDGGGIKWGSHVLGVGSRPGTLSSR